ncbi:hypothetical protein JAAARDRAFT_28202 [Jaapia argillacea MUCL 33604]|uniref:Uncharacterized protein n=1 Tax=Jaapia argillacea MUCL 33604 TaxID=933084 RepID=A0A067QBV8_9AGAM|nr:hypothetical protein JAAARDRAFT_28202 [Jaapia argillacea MUCL 33604]
MSDNTQLVSQKLTLPAFLKVLTTNNVPMSRAMAVAGKIFKTYNTTDALGRLTDFQLKFAGVEDKEDRKLVLAAIRKAGFKSSPKSTVPSIVSTPEVNSPSSNSKQKAKASSSPRKKRKRESDGNEFLQDQPPDEGAAFGSLEFNETLNEEALRSKFAVVNRAPIMMAWSTIVAERMGFKREEALSIASVYTEMNAITRGVSVGVYKDSKKSEIVEATKDGMQPYVDLMGRRPLYQTASNTWRALSASGPVSPGSAYSYITRALRQTTPHVIGALRLLAESYNPEELNRKGFGLYAEFRPGVGGWGEKGQIRCDKVLGLRKTDVQSAKTPREEGTSERASGLVKFEKVDVKEEVEEDRSTEVTGEPTKKKTRVMDEFDKLLEEDTTFDDFDFSFLDGDLP